MPKINKNIDVQISLTPEDLAEFFCGMDSVEQARFFNWVANISEKWERPFEDQMHYVSESETLNYKGIKIMRGIGKYYFDKQH